MMVRRAATDDDTRDELLRAAHDLLAAEGPGALSVRRIATAAGMSTMNVYSRFGGKDGLVDELYADGFRRLAAAMADAGQSDDPMADLLRCRAAYRSFALGNPTYYAVMFERAVPDFEPSPEATAVGLGTLAELAARLERAMDAGHLARRDPMVTAASVWATCHGLMSLEMKESEHVGIDWATVYDDTLDALIRGLASGD
jgi:AcrR family transcriptional regulator